MIEGNFQKAIERLISDGTYSKSLVADPDRLARDFSLDDKQILALKSSDTLGRHNGVARAPGFSCCCITPPEESEKPKELAMS